MTIMELYAEQEKFEEALLKEGCIHHVICGKERDIIARSILEKANELPSLTSEESKAVEWAKRRLGL